MGRSYRLSLRFEGFLPMRILRKDIKHDAITVMPEILDDFWGLYNIIEKGDTVYARTRREVKRGERYDRVEKGKRVSIYLGISVEKVIWDRYLNRLRVHGIICAAPEIVGLGSHHTLNVALNRPLKIVKEEWSRYHLEQLKRAAKRGIPPITVVSIDDEGFCVAVLRGFGVDVKAEKQVTLPGKLHAEGRTRIIKELFKSASKSLERAQPNQQASIVVLGIGYIKKDFIKYLEEKNSEVRGRVIDIKSVNSSGKAGILEALRSGILSKALKHMRVAEEAAAVEKVLERLGKSRGTVTYGLADVKRADRYGAIENLLLADVRLRESSGEERQVLEKLMREAESKKGTVTIISTEHEAGQKLNSLGGIAALLRFPIAS